MAEFCNEHNHNREAPNLQNRMCDYRSTWEVIKNSTDFENNPPLTNSSLITPPSFLLLQKRDRVICLVLDVSNTIAGVNSLSDVLHCTFYFFLSCVCRNCIHLKVVSMQRWKNLATDARNQFDSDIIWDFLFF